MDNLKPINGKFVVIQQSVKKNIGRNSVIGWKIIIIKMLRIMFLFLIQK